MEKWDERFAGRVRGGETTVVILMDFEMAAQT
jgi:hypothetical protein